MKKTLHVARWGALSIVVAALGGCSDGGVSPADGAGGSSTSGATSTSSASSGGGDGGDSGGAGQGGSGGEGGGDGGAGGKLPVCESYPFELTLPDNQATAQAELDSFAPDATMSWSSVHGTLSLITGLQVTLDCSSNDVWDGAWSFLSQHPDLFQLDESEWEVAPPFPCTAVTSSNIVNISRKQLAGVDVKKDVLAIFVSPANGGGVTLTGVSGFYLPVIAPERIQGCTDLPDSTLEQLVRQGSYPFTTFSQCAPTGSGSYVPQPNDVIEFDETWWEWEDGTGTVIAQKRRGGRLVIHEDNYTPQLLASDLNCPDETGDERILGYTLVVDPFTGEVFAMAGIGCIVC